MRQTLTAVRVPVDMAEALDRQATAAGLSRSQLYRDALADWLSQRGVSVRRTTYREQRQT